MVMAKTFLFLIKKKPIFLLPVKADTAKHGSHGCIAWGTNVWKKKVPARPWYVTDCEK